MHSSRALITTLALLGTSPCASSTPSGEQCKGIGALKLGMLPSKASQLLGGVAFQQDLYMPSALDARAQYTMRQQNEDIRGEASLSVIKGRVRHVHFNYFTPLSLAKLSIEKCGTVSWRVETPNSGNFTECRVLGPHTELEVTRSGSAVALALVDTRFARLRVSASEARVVNRHACAGR
jgi:hypothetical protein